MGIFANIFTKKETATANITGAYFEMLNGYTPIFTSAPENIYEMAIIRSAIHAFANAFSKMKPEVIGSAKPELNRLLQFKPNDFMDTTKFLYRIATILSVNNTAFIAPINDVNGEIIGYYPLIPAQCEVVEYHERAFLRYTFANGNRSALPLNDVGILTQFQYKNDFFGETNNSIKPILSMIQTQNQGIINGVKNSASPRFIGKIPMGIKDADIEKQKLIFNRRNLSADNENGIALYDARIEEVKQLTTMPFTANAVQMDLINRNVFQYYGVSQSIMQNDYTEDQWNAFYEGKIEPLALQLALVMTNMTFTEHEKAFGNQISFSSNRLQYASNSTKLNMVSSFLDRGIININEGREIMNLPPISGGETYYIRRDYGRLDD